MQYSIIVPVYNVEEYLPCLLHSLIPQISESCQIILVDDGSTDRSGVLCDQFADSCSQIEVIHQKNGGVAAARNAGLMVAHGEYLLWADPDDLVAPDWFFQINQILSQGRPDILQFDYIELEGEKRNPRCYDRNDGYIDKEVYLRDVVRDVRVNSALWCRAFHRSLFEGMHFDETLRCLEDYALLHKLILRANSIYYLPKELYIYRLRKTGLVRTINLDISYQSYLVALQREKELWNVPGFDNMGIIIQARGFCRNYFLADKPATHTTQYKECRNVLLSNWKKYFKDSEWPMLVRLKTLLLASVCAGTVYAFLKRNAV